MKQLVTDTEDLVGKTIERAYDADDSMWLSFTDGTAAIVDINIYDEDSGALYLKGRVSEFSLMDNLDAAELILSSEEIESLRMRKSNEEKERREKEKQSQRTEYERLKALFEPKPTSHGGE